MHAVSEVDLSRLPPLGEPVLVEPEGPADAGAALIPDRTGTAPSRRRPFARDPTELDAVLA